MRGTRVVIKVHHHQDYKPPPVSANTTTVSSVTETGVCRPSVIELKKERERERAREEPQDSQ